MEKISAVQDDINEVTDIMRQNIEKVVDRGEHLELLVDKSQGLNANARAFQKQSVGLKNAIWWKNCRIVLTTICLLLTLVLATLVAMCGWTLHGCRALTED